MARGIATLRVCRYSAQKFWRAAKPRRTRRAWAARQPFRDGPHDGHAEDAGQIGKDQGVGERPEEDMSSGKLAGNGQDEEHEADGEIGDQDREDPSAPRRTNEGSHGGSVGHFAGMGSKEPMRKTLRGCGVSW